MSRTAGVAPITVVRGSTWEDYFQYNLDGVPFDATGYQARMQIRTLSGAFGITTTETLVMELTTANGMLFWDTAPDGILRIRVPVDAVETLNLQNKKREVLAYAAEIYLPETTEPRYVIPLATGKINVKGWGIR